METCAPCCLLQAISGKSDYMCDKCAHEQARISKIQNDVNELEKLIMNLAPPIALKCDVLESLRGARLTPTGRTLRLVAKDGKLT